MHERFVINRQRIRRAKHVRRRIRGTADRPRLTVTRSQKHISAQVIDDESGRTLASASTLQKQIASDLSSTANCEAAAAVGKALAERAKEAGVSKVCFDRGHLAA